MESEGSPTTTQRRTNLTPKAIIYQKFGAKACYKVEEVHESTQNGCPGLSIPNKGPSLYCCTLELPGFFVASDNFKKKKDAEQSAAEMALKKLDIDLVAEKTTELEPWDSLSDRIKYLFSDEFLASLHPLSGHVKASLQRNGDLYGSVPASVITVYDAKSNNLCKLLNPKVELNPFLALPIIMRAAARLSGSIVTSKVQLSIQKQNSHPQMIQSSIIQQSVSPESIQVDAVCIPCSMEKAIQTVTLNVPSTGYYLDVIAQKLGVIDGNKVLLSRNVGKASSETRFYYTAPDSYVLDLSSDLVNVKEAQFDGPLNARASYFCGQSIYGDAIMASIGYTWRSKKLFHEDVSVQSYYRMLINKIPTGNYKLSREAIFAAELPSVFSSKANWRGSSPKEILCSFCRQHRLSEPVFSTVTVPVMELKVMDETKQDQEYRNGKATAANEGELEGSGSSFRSEVKIFSKCQDLIMKCSLEEVYKKQSDSIHNVSLKVLCWLNAYLKDPVMPFEKLQHSADVLDIFFNPENFFKEFALCPSVHTVSHYRTQRVKLLESNGTNALCTSPGQGVCSLKIEGCDSGVCPSSGSLSCVSYCVSVVSEGGQAKALLEKTDEFEFEVGIGAVISPLEAVVTQMSVGQSAFFTTDLPPEEFILAAADDFGSIFSLLTSQSCYLEFSVTLLRVTEPPEERMEQALFSPPLSKQRVEFAVQHIRKSCTTTLVDFGCGSGSLLDSLLDYPTSLETIVGVDISQRSLSRAAKILHSKLSTSSDLGIKSAVLYDGSILEPDSRLRGFDIGTCLEVIEHMEEDQACMFGDLALSYFHPKILIVSTPNYEYNTILQRSSFTSQEEDPDEKSQLQLCKFRNQDHKFEWTREQFNHWASDLARRHNYSVDFSGVGGHADVEPGFASQIAVFRRGVLLEEDDLPNKENSEQQCKVIWEWSSGSRLPSSS